MSHWVRARERCSELNLRLLIWRTGNGTEGSNPSLSARMASPRMTSLYLRD